MTRGEALARCHTLAQNARSEGEAPVGCVILRCCDGELIAEAQESVRRLLDPSAHAELVAIRSACASLETLDLSGCELYSNREPCHLCSYAIREARIRRVVFVEHVGEIGGTRPTTALLSRDNVPEWGEAPVVETFSPQAS